MSAPVDVILARVTDRANPFGSHPDERAKIVGDLAEFEPLLRAGAHHELDATASISDIVTALERLATDAELQASRSQ